jgi:hypothetical protein
MLSRGYGVRTILSLQAVPSGSCVKSCWQALFSPQHQHVRSRSRASPRAMRSTSARLTPSAFNRRFRSSAPPGSCATRSCRSHAVEPNSPAKRLSSPGARAPSSSRSHATSAAAAATCPANRYLWLSRRPFVSPVQSRSCLDPDIPCALCARLVIRFAHDEVHVVCILVNQCLAAARPSPLPSASLRALQLRPELSC